MAETTHVVMATFVNGNTECWTTEDDLPRALILAESLTTKPEHERVAEAFVYTDLYVTDSPKWWANCFFKRDGAVIEREW